MGIKIYADFHRSQRSPWSGDLDAIPLVCWGSLVDLSRLRVRLVDGMDVTVFMDSCDQYDLAADGVARFHEPTSRWLVEYDPAAIYYPPLERKSAGPLVCWSCGEPVRDHGIRPGELCLSCGALIEAPWAAPE